MEEEFVTENDELLSFPPCPEKPSDSDCCGSGCSTCIFDVYQKRLLAWQQEVEKIKSQNRQENSDKQSAETRVLHQEQFLPFQLLGIQQHTYNTFLYTFQAVRQASIQHPECIHIHQPLGFKPGQYLIMKHCNQNSEGAGLSRAYTPISGMKSSSLGRFKVLIKLYKDGKMSQYLKTLQQDDIVLWKGPFGNFDYIPNSYRYILMLCAGTGIAPMFSIARAVVKNEDDETSIHMFFACKTLDDILLRQKLQKLAGYWNFSVEIFLSCAQHHNLEQKVFYRENIKNHKINREVVTKELSGKDPNTTLALICGTKSFNKDMMSYVKSAGISDSNIYVF